MPTTPLAAAAAAAAAAHFSHDRIDPSVALVFPPIRLPGLHGPDSVCARGGGFVL